MAKLEAYRLDTGIFLIQGTQDLEVARALLEEHDHVRDIAPDDCDWQVVIHRPDPNLFRKNPCPPQCGEHGWHMGYARQRGRGVFEGILIDEVTVEPVEYEIDLEWDLTTEA